jgi:hypothetical protein
MGCPDETIFEKFFYGCPEVAQRYFGEIRAFPKSGKV